MKFWKKDSVDLESNYKAAQKAYGVKNPEKMRGFRGGFGFSFGDIYAEEKTYDLIRINSNFEAVVNACLKCFRNLDYGRLVSKDEDDLNFKNRHFIGNLCGLIGRYDTRYGVLEIEMQETGGTQIRLFPRSENEPEPTETKKRLYVANVVRDIGKKEEAYRLDPVGEKVMGEVWDGDIEKLLRVKNRHYNHPEDIIYYKTYPFESPLDRNGIFGDDELFVEFDDGDLWAMTLYYTKSEE